MTLLSGMLLDEMWISPGLYQWAGAVALLIVEIDSERSSVFLRRAVGIG